MSKKILELLTYLKSWLTKLVKLKLFRSRAATAFHKRWVCPKHPWTPGISHHPTVQPNSLCPALGSDPGCACHHAFECRLDERAEKIAEEYRLKLWKYQCSDSDEKMMEPLLIAIRSHNMAPISPNKTFFSWLQSFFEINTEKYFQHSFSENFPNHEAILQFCRFRAVLQTICIIGIIKSFMNQLERVHCTRRELGVLR